MNMHERVPKTKISAEEQMQIGAGETRETIKESVDAVLAEALAKMEGVEMLPQTDKEMLIQEMQEAEAGGVFQTLKEKFGEKVEKIVLFFMVGSALLGAVSRNAEGAEKKGPTRTEEAQRPPSAPKQPTIVDLKRDVDRVIENVGKALAETKINMPRQPSPEATQKLEKEAKRERIKEIGKEVSDVRSRLRKIQDALETKYVVPSEKELAGIVVKLEEGKVAYEGVAGTEIYSTYVESELRAGLFDVRQIQEKLKSVSEEKRATMGKQRALYEKLQGLEEEKKKIKGFTGTDFDNRRRLEKEISALDEETDTLSGRKKVKSAEDKMLEELGQGINKIGEGLKNLEEKRKQQ